MELKNENFNELIKDCVVLVDFFATWCGPCKMQASVLEQLKEDVKIIKIDVDEHEDLAKEYAVMSIPTLILFKDGEIIKKQVGFTPKTEILSWIENL